MEVKRMDNVVLFPNMVRAIPIECPSHVKLFSNPYDDKLEFCALNTLTSNGKVSSFYYSSDDSEAMMKLKIDMVISNLIKSVQ